MKPRGEEAGVRDGFFYPESTVARAAAKTRRPPGRGPRGPRLPWLLCALLLALMAAAGTWVFEPLRRQLAQARAAQAAAVANVLQLQAERQAALAATSVSPTPHAALDEGAAWAQARRQLLEAQLAEDLSQKRVQVRVVGARVEISVPFASPAAAGPDEGTRRLFVAVGRALAADESPYRLTLFVPVAPEASSSRPRSMARHRRRRGRHAMPPLVAPTGEQAAAEAAARLLEVLQADLAQRAKSTVEGAFGKAAEGAQGALQLRLERALP